MSLEKSAISLIQENKIKPKTKLGLSSLLNFLEKRRNDSFNIKINQTILNQNDTHYQLIQY